MVFDPTHAEIEMSSFKEQDWQQFHGNVSKPTLPNMPQPRGKAVEICLHVLILTMLVTCWSGPCAPVSLHS
jgi:hypothetical protein